MKSFKQIRYIRIVRNCFFDLWEYWLEYHLLEPVKGTPLAELTYEELYELLSEEQKDYYAKKKREFLKTAEMENMLRLV